jgi:hypothetical protein
MGHGGAKGMGAKGMGGWGKLIGAIALGAIAIGPISCASAPSISPEPTVSVTPPAVPAPSPASDASRSLSPRPAARASASPATPQSTNQAAATPKTTVFIYNTDRQCLNLVSEKVVLPKPGALEAAIARILDTWDNADFDLAGYRVTVENGMARVDFRVAPGSTRQLASLSSCEQLGLLGSIRKTLMANSQWQIQEVEFTQQGKAL